MPDFNGKTVSVGKATQEKTQKINYVQPILNFQIHAYAYANIYNIHRHRIFDHSTLSHSTHEIELYFQMLQNVWTQITFNRFSLDEMPTSRYDA